MKRQDENGKPLIDKMFATLPVHRLNTGGFRI